MIISKIEGGLGNQMFQYAAARALSIKTGSQIKLDLSWFDQYQLHNGYELDKFNIKATIATQDEIKSLAGNQSSFSKAINKILGVKSKHYILEPDFTYYSRFKTLVPPVYLHGYWQSYKYFEEFSYDIRSDLTPILELSKESQNVAEKIRDIESVSIHIRRGDYVTNKQINNVHGVLGLDYYHNAINFLINKLEAPTFLIFSDDPQWVKDNVKLKFPTLYINHNYGDKSFEDMQLMSLCKHNVIANSSFSWWGAWLNRNPEKTVITPKNWFASEKSIKDLIQDSWLKK